MKQLDLPQPLLLVTIGTPGTGKSTFAKQLSESLNFAWIHGGRLRRAMFPSPSLSRDEESAMDGLAEHTLKETLRTKGNILYDGNANTRAARMRISKLAREAGYQVLLVWLQTDSETAQLRAGKRGSRPQDDEFALSLAPDAFEYFAKQLTRPAPNEHYVVISGKHAFPTQVRTLLTKIDELYRPKEPPKPAPAGKLVKEQPKKPKPVLPSVEDIHRAGPVNPPKSERSRPRFDITRHIKFR